MAIKGDLSTLELADLLQSLEMHRRTGLLTVQGDNGRAHLFFKDGRLALFGAEDRPRLVDVLVASGAVSTRDLERAKSKRKGSGRSLGELLVEMRAITAEELTSVARARLLDDACEWIASTTGEFHFEQGRIPRGTFDPEERRLELALPVGPLLLESATRADHWRVIRNRIPSDAAHFFAHRPPKIEEGDAGAELTRALIERLDGTESVSEVLASFPHRRFEAYRILADLLEGRAVRLTGADELGQLARRLAPEDQDRAMELIERGLAAQPHNLDLLEEQARLAEARGEIGVAVEALKLLAHLKLEGGATAKGRELLERARALAPEDSALCERSFQLARSEGRTQDALAAGWRLVELYRAPGLHRKAAAVLETLVAMAAEPEEAAAAPRPRVAAGTPRSPSAPSGSAALGEWQLRRELAQTRVDCGEAARGTEELAHFGKARLALEDWAGARVVFQELAALDPVCEEARAILASIDSGELARRRERRRKIARSLRTGALAAGLVLWVAYESMARFAWIQATRAVGRAHLIEERRYDEALELLSAVGERYPLSTTAWFDCNLACADLETKAAGSGSD